MPFSRAKSDNSYMSTVSLVGAESVNPAEGCTLQMFDNETFCIVVKNNSEQDCKAIIEIGENGKEDIFVVRANKTCTFERPGDAENKYCFKAVSALTPAQIKKVNMKVCNRVKVTIAYELRRRRRGIKARYSKGLRVCVDSIDGVDDVEFQYDEPQSASGVVCLSSTLSSQKYHEVEDFKTDGHDDVYSFIIMLKEKDPLVTNQTNLLLPTG